MMKRIDFLYKIYRTKFPVQNLPYKISYRICFYTIYYKMAGIIKVY